MALVAHFQAREISARAKDACAGAYVLRMINITIPASPDRHNPSLITPAPLRRRTPTKINSNVIF